MIDIKQLSFSLLGEENLSVFDVMPDGPEIRNTILTGGSLSLEHISFIIKLLYPTVEVDSRIKVFNPDIREHLALLIEEIKDDRATLKDVSLGTGVKIMMDTRDVLNHLTHREIVFDQQEDSSC